MIRKPIYSPSGRAEEYSKDHNGNLAINIYNGCSHGCKYCYAKTFNDRYKRGDFSKVEPRKDIVESVKRQLQRENFKNKTIFLCFLCDPFPVGYDHEPTYDIIKLIKDSGNHVRILTKGNPDKKRLFDMLDGNDFLGVTISCDNEFAGIIEPYASRPSARKILIMEAKEAGIKTFVSCEPVFQVNEIYSLISNYDFIDEYKIGKLNHCKSEINWDKFGRECRKLCELYNLNYTLKYDLLKEMGDV